jgi:Bacterial RNA polymerase, alpha chain C terminal domain
VSTIRKSTDPGLTNAERKGLRESEAREAMSDHDDAEKAFHDNRERLREARLAREADAGPMLYPAPGLPDETPIENVRFSTRIANALNTASVKTVGEIRQASDATLQLSRPWSELNCPPSRNSGAGAFTHAQTTRQKADLIAAYCQARNWLARRANYLLLKMAAGGSVFRSPGRFLRLRPGRIHPAVKRPFFLRSNTRILP